MAEKIMEYVQTLPESKQVEVLGLVEYLRSKVEKQEIKDWTDLCLSSAMREIGEEQTLYTLNDIKESIS